MPRHRYTVPQELIDDARKAKDWYETKGMKVAQTPAIPHMVASWILLKCDSDRPVVRCRCTHEAGDSDCDVHPTDPETGEPIGNWRTR